MERHSDKHTPRLDDEMRQETESLVRGSPVEARAEEFREQEGAAEGEPDTGLVATRANEEEANRRAELARHLPPSCFPARPGELVQAAAASGAAGHELALLESLPDWRYASVAEVWQALGGSVEQRSGARRPSSAGNP